MGGRLDGGGGPVAEHNAGYGQFELIEEISESEARDQLETNLGRRLRATRDAIATADYESRLAIWREWEPVSVAAHGKRG